MQNDVIQNARPMEEALIKSESILAIPNTIISQQFPKVSILGVKKKKDM